MSSVLYQTFYPYNKFDNVTDICNLNQWMLTKELMAKSSLTLVPRSGEATPPGTVENVVNTPITQIKIVKPRFLTPDRGDVLFWCVYMYHYGEDNYLAIGNKYGNAEIAEKQRIMEFLKSNKYALKNVNRKITLSETQEIMSDLMTNTKTSLQTLMALSVFYKKCILLLNDNNKTYIEYLFDKEQAENIDTKWMVIKYMENKKYGFFVEGITDISEYCKEYIRIETHNKPLKGISTYKNSELISMAANIPELAKEPKMPKPDLYGKLWQYCLWV